MKLWIEETTYSTWQSREIAVGPLDELRAIEGKNIARDGVQYAYSGRTFAGLRVYVYVRQ